jgi:8-oxo-dGTP diphosphatase
MEYTFTSAGARWAAEQGLLEDWVHGFLRGPGNNAGFADGLGQAPRFWVGPVTWPLNQIPRTCGPEPGMRWAVPRETFEARVSRLIQAYSGPWDAPPLVVEVTPEGLVLNDGNHRHEALVRAGRTSAPVIFWATEAPEVRRLEREFGPWAEIERLWHEGLDQGRRGVVGALVRRDDGRLFAQKRSADRKTFPGCWDLAGGHMEPGEGPWEAMNRELFEETGWTLGPEVKLRQVVDWESPDAQGRPVLKREFVLSVTLVGDPDHPRLEADKVSEGRWFGPGDLEVLNEGRTGSDRYVYDLFQQECS